MVGVHLQLWSTCVTSSSTYGETVVSNFRIPSSMTLQDRDEDGTFLYEVVETGLMQCVFQIILYLEYISLVIGRLISSEFHMKD